MKKLLVLFLLLFAAKTAFFAQKSPKKARLPAVLPEASGLVARPDGTFWLLNDSGNRPILWRVDARGRLVDSVDLSSKIKNIDWEELAFWPQKGQLVIGDFGNNSNARHDLALHLFDEKSRALETVFFDLEDQKTFPPADQKDWNFDLEAMVVVGDSAHLFSKSHWQRGDFSCSHYALTLRPGAGRQTAFLREKMQLKKRVVSAATLAPDGRTLALVGYRFGRRLGFFPFAKATVFLFETDGSTAFFAGKRSRLKPPYLLFAKQWEAAQFIDNQRLMLANEKILWQKPRLRTMRIRH